MVLERFKRTLAAGLLILGTASTAKQTGLIMSAGSVCLRLQRSRYGGFRWSAGSRSMALTGSISTTEV